MNALVSGIASDIGFGIGRVIREWGIFNSIYGMDMHEDHAGSCVFDDTISCPAANDPTYLQWLEKHIFDNRIGIFIPTSEAEIAKLSKLQVDTIGSCKVLINNASLVATCLDKHETMTHLDKFGISTPKFGLLGTDFPNKYPVIVKPRSGQGSKGIAKVISKKDLLKIKADNLVWQEYLSSDDNEYTIPIYRSYVSGIRMVIIKRKLVGGLTGSGEVVKDNDIYNYALKIANVLDFQGCINIQLRTTKSGPKLFEINPRISSTVVFRDKLGFSDLKWWISDVINLGLHEYTEPETGTKFFRGSQEYILTPEKQGSF